MFKTKLASSRLSLTYLFDLPSIVKEPSSADHDAAVKKAAVHIGLVPAAAVAAKAFARAAITLPVVHASDFDQDFHLADGGPALRFEFYYDPDAPKMAIRIVTTLGEEPSMIIDGVLASRHAFHAMEILEGKALTTDSPGNRKDIPPLTYGIRQQLNFMFEIIPGTLVRIVFAYFSLLLDLLFFRRPPSDPTLVNDAKSMFRFYNSNSASEPCVFQTYTPATLGPKPFRAFLALIDAWRKVRELAGFFYLINFSPQVAPGVTANVNDIARLSNRYKNCFDRAGSGPPPPLWVVSNPQMARRLFINNYGVHSHNFCAKPVSYVWDWLELAAPIHGAGCITLNGTFMFWIRGMPSAVRQAALSHTLGEPIATFPQNQKWFAAMGLPASIAPKEAKKES